MFLRLLPLRYNIRSVGRRQLRTLLTVTGIALVVFVCIMMLAFSVGIRASLKNTASGANAIIVNANAFDDLTLSRVDKGAADTFAAGAGGILEEHGRLAAEAATHRARVLEAVENLYAGK